MTVRRGVEASGCLRLDSVPALPSPGGRRSTTQQRQKMIGGRAGPKGAHVMASARRDYLPESERRSYPTRPACPSRGALGSSAVIPRRY